MSASSSTIIMPLYNNIALTRTAIDKVYANSPAELDWQLIMVDNASTDATVEERPRDSRSRILRNGRNEGFARACNQGAMLADGDILVFLNNDTEVQPGWLEALVDELDRHEETGLAGARLLYPDGTIQHAGVAIGRDLVPYHIHRGLPASAPIVMERRPFPILTGACLAARRKDFLALGMFDEGFINGHEDIDLCFRYRQQGKQCVYRPDCVVVHHESVSPGRFNARLHNLQRTFAKSRAMLVQDDFRYGIAAADRREDRLRIAIKVDVPNREHQTSNDIPIAEELARELTRIGHDCVIHYLCEWGKEDGDIDAVVHLAGPSTYFPKPWNTNILWRKAESHTGAGASPERYDAMFDEGVSHDIATARCAQELQGAIEKAETLEVRHRKTRCSKTIADEAYRRNGPLVSVLMSANGHEGDLADAIRSVVAQTYTNWELRIACSGKGNTGDIAGPFADARVRMEGVPENCSRGEALDLAFRSSAGEYVAYLRAEDRWRPDHLERLLSALRSVPGISMAYADAEHVVIDHNLPPHRREVSRTLPCQDQVTLEHLLEGNCINASSVVHSRALFEQVGGFDAKLEALQDFDMWRRLAAITYPYHVNYVTVDHILSHTERRYATDPVEGDPIRYARQRVRVLCKNIFPQTCHPFVEKIATVRKRALSEYFVLLFEKALKDGGKSKADIYLRLLRKHHTPREGGKYAYALMKLHRYREAMSVFKTCMKPETSPIADILLAILCGILVRDRYALSLVKCMEKSARLISAQERDIFLEYKTKCEALFARERQESPRCCPIPGT